MTIEEFIQDVARGAGGIIKDKYQVTKVWREKADPGDIVTEVDEASERYVIERIRAEFPEDRIFSEESGAVGDGKSNVVWVIDPLDGTKNYMMNIPFFCVSIGRSIDGVVETGAIYDPLHDEMFFAARGRGAYLNGEPIHVSRGTTVNDSLINVSWVKSKVDLDDFVRYVDDLCRRTSYFRRLGSAALMMAYIACGRMDGYLQGGLNSWDVAAGVALIEEAGGVVSDFDGKPVDLRNAQVDIITANPDIYRELIELVGHLS